jgi:hypothetical protein
MTLLMSLRRYLTLYAQECHREAYVESSAALAAYG